jgi:carbon storage regulator CsrA
MLVLSRRVKDSIEFPELDIKVEILQVKGSTVRVGIDAPVEIKIIRGELANESTKYLTKKLNVSGDSEHEIRNKLNSLKIAAAYAKELIAQGEPRLAASKLDASLASIGGDSDTVENSGLTALLVEDTANEREMLAGFLRLHGYNVRSVGDGVAALEYLEANSKPDVILMDINLPRMNGAQAIRRIRENPAFDGIEIFAVSGESPSQAGINAQENRIAKWFQKPLEPSQLISAINQHVAITNFA